MNLLPQNQSIDDQEFTNLAVKILDADYSMLEILPMSVKAQLLPHLAVMFDVDIAGLNESESRKYIYNALEIHRYKGTVYAAQKAIDSVFDKGQLIEWFDADLTVGLFNVEVKLEADITKVYTLEKFERVRKMINDAKNVRSHLNDFIIELPAINSSIATSVGTSSLQAKTKSDFEFINNAQINIQGGYSWLI